MGHTPMFIDSNDRPYVELVQLLVGIRIQPNPAYVFPNMEAADRFARLNVGNSVRSTLVYDKGGVLRCEYHADGTEKGPVWKQLKSGWTSLDQIS